MSNDADEKTIETLRHAAWGAAQGDEVPVKASDLQTVLGRVNGPRNGWKNHETWATHLWLTNDQGTLYAAREAAQDGEDALKDFIERLAGLDDMEASLASDLIHSAISEIDLWELREALTEEQP